MSSSLNAAGAFGSTDTRDAILTAAERILCSRRSFSMGGVAKAAGVSRQAVYLHFADRFGLLDAVVQRATERSGLALSRRAITDAPNARDALARYLQTVTRLAAAHGALDQAVRATLAADPKLATRWSKRRGRQALAKQVATRLEDEGLLADDVDAAQAQTTLLAFGAPAFTVALLERFELDVAARVIQRAVEAALFGIQA